MGKEASNSLDRGGHAGDAALAVGGEVFRRPDKSKEPYRLLVSYGYYVRVQRAMSNLGPTNDKWL